MSVSVVPPYMFRSIPLTIFRGCSCCNANLRLVVFVTTLSGHVAVFSVSITNALLAVHWLWLNIILQKIQPHAQPDKVVTKTTRRRVALPQEQPLTMVKGIARNMQSGTTDRHSNVLEE
jgi:hypothetical protein